MPSSNSDRLVITNRPVITWVMGAIFMIIGLLTATSSGGPLFIGLIFGGVGMLVFLLGGFGVQLVLDKTEGSARLTRYTIAGKRVDEYMLSEISTVEVARSSSYSRGSSTTYRIELVLTGGERLPLTSYYTSGMLGKQLQADKIRNFLGPQSPGDRAAAVLGVSAVKGQMTQQMYQAQPVESSRGAGETDTTDGVTWEIKRLMSPSGGKVTRWFSDGAKTPGSFLMLVQGGSNQPGGKGLGAMLGSLAQMIYRQYIGMYQVAPDETPEIDSAQPVQNLDPRLAEKFVTLTNDPLTARQLLNPWTVGPLADWAARHPAGGFQVMRDNTFGPVFVLFSPRGVTVAFASMIDNPAMVDEITRLGVELVRANSTH